MNTPTLLYLSIYFSGACLATGLMCIGLGMCFSAAINGTSRNPSQASKLQTLAIIGAGFMEFAFFILMLIYFLNQFKDHT